MRPALPPLAPSRTGMEIAKSPAKFGDLSHKIALIEKARTAVTTLDLNEIIDELLTIYDDDTKAMHNLQTMNSVKNTELATAKKKLDKMRSAYHELKQNTAILGLLEKEDLPQKNSRLAKSILELDEERLSHKPPAIAEKPSEFIARSESDLLKFILSRAKMVYMMLDTSKIGKIMPYTFATPEDIDVLITDDNFPQSVKEKFEERNIVVI